MASILPKLQNIFLGPVYFRILTLIIFLLIISPGRDIFALIPSPYDKKRFIQLLVISLCCLIIILSRSLRHTIHDLINSTPFIARISLLVIIALGLFSSFFSPKPEYAFLELTLDSGVILFSITIAALTIHDAKLFTNAFLYALICYAVIYEVSFFSSYVAALVIDGNINTNIIHSGFENIRFFNQYQIWSLSILCLPLFLQPRLSKKIRTLIFIIAALWVTLLFSTNSRGAVLSYLLGLLITAIIFRSRAMPLIKINAQYLIAGLGIYILLFIIPPLLIHSEVAISRQIFSTASSSARLHLWALALTYIQESPWLGIGPMHYAYYPNTIAAHPHNSIIQLAAEFGLPATLLIASLAAWFLILWVRNTPNEMTQTKTTAYFETPIIWIALFCALISGLIYSLVSGVIVTPMGQSMLALLLGIMIGLLFLKIKRAYTTFEVEKRIFLSVTFIASLILIALTYLVTPQLTTRILTPFWGQYVPYHTVGPRFWRAGGIIQVPRQHK